MNFPLLFTLAGPAVGAYGWFSSVEWAFWAGVALCVVNLALNMASGVMRLPILPMLFMAGGVGAVHPWYSGLGVGLIAWTALEAAGAVVGRLRARRAE